MVTALDLPQPKDIWSHIDYLGDLTGGQNWIPTEDEHKNVRSFHERKLDYNIRSAENGDHRETFIRDLRGHEDDFTIDRQGFQLCRLNSENVDWDKAGAIQNTYYPEVAELLKRVTSASKVYIYDHHIRNQTLEGALKAPADDTTVDITGPAQRAHIDETPTNARRIIHDFVPANEISSVEHKHFAIINVWRPLKTVARDPLGVIDARTIRPEDKVVMYLPATEEMGGDYEVFNLKFGENEMNGDAKKGETSQRHQWWYVRAQKPTEALCLKIYDSRDEDGFMGVGHCSFRDKEAEIDGDGNEVGPRESIECRALCFF